MNHRSSPTSNPFSTRFIRPGATTYRFPPGVSETTLAKTFFENHGGRAAIVGPHGSGKTSLLYALAPHLGTIVESHLCDGDPIPKSTDGSGKSAAPGLQVFWFRLMVRGREASPHVHVQRTPQRESLQALMHSRRKWQANTLLVIDGWEQIRWPMRGWIYWNAKRSLAKLLVTSHRKTILPTLWDSQVRPEIAQQVVRDLLEAAQRETHVLAQEQIGHICDPIRLQQAVAANQGSLREVLFQLYDEFEHTCRSDQQKGS